MGKLIDAGLLLNNLSGMLKSMDDYDAVRKVVNNMPTAYDVNEVVKQLEKEKQTSISAKIEAIIEMCGASANHYGGEEYAYQKAIEIVKGGGVDKKQ